VIVLKTTLNKNFSSKHFSGLEGCTLTAYTVTDFFPRFCYFGVCRQFFIWTLGGTNDVEINTYLLGLDNTSKLFLRDEGKVAWVSRVIPALYCLDNNELSDLK
jgi:hypothetical protein